MKAPPSYRRPRWGDNPPADRPRPTLPELPEVETVRRGVAPHLEGRVIVDAEARRPDLRWPLPGDFAARLTGNRVERVGRRSKYILADLSSGETLIVHLGMSGRIRVETGDRPSAPGSFHHPRGQTARHDHVTFATDGGARIIYNDARRFGAMDLWPTARIGEHALLRHLGPEPNGPEFDARALERALAGRATSIKAALLDQRIVAGLGNIYVSEALHRARISPRRRAGNLGRGRIDRLAEAIRAVLAEAIAAGGSSLRDHRRADGEMGYFQHAFRAYGRHGAACPTPGCSGAIRRIAQGGRSSFYCSGCQR